MDDDFVKELEEWLLDRVRAKSAAAARNARRRARRHGGPYHSDYRDDEYYYMLWNMYGNHGFRFRMNPARTTWGKSR